MYRTCVFYYIAFAYICLGHGARRSSIAGRSLMIAAPVCVLHSRMDCAHALHQFRTQVCGQHAGGTAYFNILWLVNSYFLHVACITQSEPYSWHIGIHIGTWLYAFTSEKCSQVCGGSCHSADSQFWHWKKQRIHRPRRTRPSLVNRYHFIQFFGTEHVWLLSHIIGLCLHVCMYRFLQKQNERASHARTSNQSFMAIHKRDPGKLQARATNGSYEGCLQSAS